MIFRSSLPLGLLVLSASKEAAGAGLGMPVVDLLTSVHEATLNVSPPARHLEIRMLMRDHRLSGVSTASQTSHMPNLQ